MMKDTRFMYVCRYSMYALLVKLVYLGSGGTYRS